MKYKTCTSLADIATVNSNYLEQDIDDGCWFYQLPNLINGDNMFYNDSMTELYDGRVPLRHFESNLQSLQSGVNMFKGCALDAVSVKRIADTLSSASPGTITLGIHYSLEGDSSVAASLAKIESKGWSVETEYNLPYGFTELEYLDSSGTQYLDTGIMPTSTMKVTTELAPLSWTFVNMTWGSIAWAEVDNNLAFSPNYNMTHEATRPIMYWYGSNYAFFDRNYRHELGVKHSYIFDKNKLYQNGVLLSYTNNTSLPEQTFIGTTYPILVFAAVWGTDGVKPGGGKRFWNFNIKDNGLELIDLVPVLDAAGIPCMYDKVSHACFYNKGTGKFGYRIKRTGDESAPFSLRDPYYVAPSGVYARPSGENELDMLADTEMEADIAEQEGYTWFPNTGEAYEHFGITQQPAEGEVIDA